MALCPVCETFDTECGMPACTDCLDTWGTDPDKLERVAIGLAERRRDARKANSVWRAVNNLKTRSAA